MQVSCIANPRSDVTMFVQISNNSVITVPFDSQITSVDLPNMTNDTNTVNTVSTPVWVVPMIALPWLLLSIVTFSVLVYMIIIKGMLI